MRAAAAARRALPLAIVLLVAVFVARIEWSAAAAALRAAAPPLVGLSLAAELASVAAKGMRWWIFLRPLGPAGLPLALRATFAGAAADTVLIANGGDAVRVALLARALDVPAARVVATLALDRAWEAVGYGSLLVLATATAPLPPELDRLRPAALAALGGLLAGLLALTRRRPRDRRRPAVDDGPSERLAAQLRRVVDALSALSTPRRSAAAFALSLVVWATQLATYACAAAAVGVSLTVSGHVLTLLTVNLGFAVRVTPGGVGVFQALYALATAPLGVAAPTAIAAAILVQAVQIVPITAIGLVAVPGLLRRGAVASAQ